jgi:hypothetical protein
MEMLIPESKHKNRKTTAVLKAEPNMAEVKNYIWLDLIYSPYFLASFNISCASLPLLE